jgi:hypothetical protein
LLDANPQLAILQERHDHQSPGGVDSSLL